LTDISLIDPATKATN